MRLSRSKKRKFLYNIVTMSNQKIQTLGKYQIVSDADLSSFHMSDIYNLKKDVFHFPRIECLDKRNTIPNDPRNTVSHARTLKGSPNIVTRLNNRYSAL